MKSYDKETFEHLVLLVRKDDKSDREWLLNNNCRELVEFFDAIEGMENSFKWLLDNNYRQLAATVDGYNGNDKAKLFLVKSGNRELAAFIDACDGSKSAIAYLMKQERRGWLLVAKEFFDKEEKKEKKGLWGMLFNLGNPFR